MLKDVAVSLLYVSLQLPLLQDCQAELCVAAVVQANSTLIRALILSSLKVQN